MLQHGVVTRKRNGTAADGDSSILSFRIVGAPDGYAYAAISLRSFRLRLKTEVCKLNQ